MFKFEEVQKRLYEYINNGGDIYLPKRQLPYYDYMHEYKRQLEKQENKKYDMIDIYKMFGIDYDREYNIYKQFYTEASILADKDGYIDGIKKYKGVPNSVYSHMIHLSRKYNCSFFDFTVLMTGFKFKIANIQMDYVENLKKEILKAYPNKNITGIRHERSDLYERIRHLRKYMPENLSMKDTLLFLGFTNDKCKDDLKKHIDKIQIQKELALTCPDKDACSLLKKNSQLYFKIVKLALQEDVTVQVWFESNGYKYTYGSNIPRLSKVKVDPEKRYKELIEAKKKYNHELKGLSPVEKYYKKIKIMQKVLQELDTQTIETVENTI